MKVILTEKPSVARDIAAFLGANQRHEGYLEGNGYQVTWALGHLIMLKEPEDYDPALKKWSLHNLPFIPGNFELKLSEDKGARKQFAVIKKLLKSAKELICATDAGREGELIFRYIIALTSWEKKNWKRLWLSSLTEEALKAGFENLRQGSDFDCLYWAAKCRSQADWIVGLNATRNFTVRYGGKGVLWSVGRVQTPVLALLVKREDEIRHFKSEPFWEVWTKYREVAFKFKGERFKSKTEAETVLNKIINQPFQVEKVTKKAQSEPPPLLYDLTELQREMNRKHGISAADTLQIAQTLYEQKLITYPRTDSRYLSSDMKNQVAEVLCRLKPFKAAEIQPLNLQALNFSSRVLNNSKVTDHHAIIPTGKLPGALPWTSQVVFEAIVIRLIAVFYPACQKEVTCVEGQSNAVKFQAKGTRIVLAGWSALYPKKKEEGKEALSVENEALPAFYEGESGPHDPLIHQGKTNPPPYYTENTLLGAMETAGKLIEDEDLKEALKGKGLGTPATRASIIETLIKRAYVQRHGKTLRATDLGRYLIALIPNPQLKSPELTGDWEARLKAIEQGRASPVEFMQGIVGYTAQIVAESDLSKLNYAAYGDCPFCKSPVIKGRRGYGCSKWREGCGFVLWSEYNGRHLSEQEIRMLLQKKIALGSGVEGILVLSDSGQLETLAHPVAQTAPRAYYTKRSAAAKAAFRKKNKTP